MNTARRAAQLASYVVLLVGAAACGSETGSSGDRAEDPGAVSLDGDWTLIAATPFRLVDGHPITLSVDGTKASGRSACNSYGGSVDTTGNNVRFGQLGGTEMACSPGSVMELEQTYLTALQAVDAAEVAGESLTLTGPGVSMTFEPVPPVPSAALVGTRWILESLVDGDSDEAPVSTAMTGVGSEPASLRLADDGTMTGSTGCRRLEGEWSIEGGEVLFTNFGLTGSCPPDLRDQDDHVVGALGDGFTADVDGDVLRVSGRFGTGLVYRRH